MLDWLKSTGRVCALFLGVFALSSAVQAGPKDGRIVNGSGSISHSGTHTDIRQNSDFLSTRWGSFNIGANESVQAHQPGASSRLLIRVDGGGATNIAGSYTSNGITILENQNGVQFSRGAIVNVGGLLATSSRISGVGGNNWQLNGTGGAVVNHGTIAAGAGGAILAAVKVQNTGDITAKGGDVALGAGSSFTVDFAGSMVGFEITKAASGASITNSGKIEAQGGVVALSAQEAQAVRTNVISVGGVVKATRIERRGGVVYLSGGDEGVAEVSGDVQASEQIQTTGEYVVVKEGAVLTAPDILVGGDFQGRGDVQTAQRTLVERGALLDAGAEGRVIVWSDDVTWFNGNINVPGGFAEVSGKGNLAAVNLPGINVGAGGTLLLDPLHISIVADNETHIDLPARGVLFADPPDADRTSISAVDVGNFVGALELQVRGGIQIRANIASTTLTSLTLRAQDANGENGADNTVNAPGEDANNIGFFGQITLDLGEASLTLIAGVINVRGSNTAAITASGGVTFRFTRDGFTSEADAAANALPGNITGTPVTYAFGLDAVADNISATAINCAGQTSVCSITRATDENVQISSGNLSARTSLTIDINLGVLSFAGTGLITVSAPTVSITAGSLDIGTRNLIIEATGGSLTLNTPIINGATGVGASRVLRAVNGSITIGDNIAGANNNNNANIDSDLTISSTGTGAGIILDADIDLRGRAVELTGAIAGTEGTSRGLEIRTVSLGNITLNSDINLRGGELDLRTDRNGGRIITTGSPVIMVGVLSLLEGADAGAATGYTANLFSTMSRATDQAIIRVASNAQAAVIHPWMAMLNAGEFILQAVGSGAIPMVTLPASFVSTGNIELRAGAIALSADATTTLSGAAVTLTGGITGAGALNLTATDRLTLNSGIAIGGALAIIAGERINLANANTVITAGAFTINFTDPAVANDEAAGFSLDGGTTTTRNNFAASSSTPTITFIPDIPDDDCIRNGEACSLIRDDANLETADASLESDVSITISIGTGTLTFGGSGEITIEAATSVSITAGNIDIGTRRLTITASGGALTLNTDITADAGSMGNVEIFATGGALTIGGDINARGGALTLSSTGTNAGITLNSNVTLDGAAITLTGAIDESGMGGNDALTVTATGALTLNDNIDIGSTGDLSLSGATIALGNNLAFLRGGAITLTGAITRPVGTANLTVIASGALTLNDNIDIGTGALSLSGTSIVLGGPITLDGAAITLTGAIDESGMGGNDALTVTASGGMIRIGGDINLGTGALSLTGSNIVTPGTPTLTASMVSLTQASAFSAAPPFTFATPTLNLTATTPQPFYGWMVDRNFVRSAGVTGRNLNLTGAGITLTANVNAGGGNLTLVATGGNNITQDGSYRLEGAAITLTGLFDSSSQDFAFTITATDDITLNSDIDLSDEGNLTLTATGNNIVLGGDITLTSGAITLTGAIDASGTGNGGNHALTITAGGRITLNDNINTGTGALSLSNSFGGIALGNSLITLTGGLVTLTGAIDESANGDSLTIEASGTGRVSNLVIGGNINLGAGVLTLTSRGGGNIFHDGTLRTLTASTVSLTQDIAFTAAAPFTFMTPTLNLTATTSQQFFGWMVDRNFVRSVGVTGRNLNLTGAGITLTRSVDAGGGNLTLTATGGNSITQDGSYRLEGAAITLTGLFDSSSQDFAFTITATDDITLNSDIDLSDEGNLTLTATGSNIVLGNDITLTSGAIMLTGAIDASGTGNGGNHALTITAGGRITLNDNINTGTGALSLSNSFGGIALGGDIELDGGAITLDGTIDDSNALTVDASGVLRLNSNIDTGAGNLTLEGGNIVLGSALTALAGNAVSLTGAITRPGPVDLAITATGPLTLNNDIDLGSTGTTLAITANALINVPNTITVTAEAFTIAFTDPAVQDTATGFDGSFGNLAPIIVPTFTPPLAADCGSDADCMLGTIGEDLLVAATLTAADSITINIGSANTLTFAGGATDPIMITSDVVDITAGDINIGTRPLTIIARTGALTLNTNIATTGALILSGDTIMLGGTTTLGGAAITLTGEISGGALTVTASGVLTLNSDINIGTAALSLTAGDGGAGNDAGNIVGVGTLTLTAGTVSLTQAGVFASDAPFMFASTVNTLSLEVTAATTTDDNRQTVYGWMTSDNRALSLTSNRAILIGISATNTTVSTGTGDLTLDGEDIVLGFSSATLTGGNVELTGEIDKTGSDTIVIIRAMANITLNSNITLDADTTLTLTAGMGGTGNIIADSARTFNATRVTLGQRMAFTGPTAPFTIFATSLTLMTAANQTVYDWMAGRILDLTSDGVITISGNINTGGNALTLTGRSGISLTAAAILTGGAIRLDGAITGTNDFTVNAAGALTLNSDITIGGAALSLSAGAGAIMNGSTVRALTAGTVSLNQAAAFPGTEPFTFGSATSLTLTTATPQTVHGWMTSGNRALSLTTTGAITVNDNIDTGTRALTLMGTSIFLRGGERTLEGSAVTLTGVLDSRVSGDSASANNIIITADTGNIMITGNITASGNDGVSSNEPGGNGGAVNLTATLGNIMITGDIITTGDFSDVGGVRGSNGGALTLMAPDGNITIGGSINLNGARAANFQDVAVTINAAGGNGGSLTLMAGDIMIGNVNARGGRGGTAFGVSTTAGDGGNGGVIMITASGTATINGITARGGAAGDNMGNSTAGSAGAGGQAMITATGGDLTLMGSINVSGGALTLRAPGNDIRVIGSVPTLTASTVTINQGDAFAENLVIAEATSLILTVNDPQIVRRWMTAGSNRSLSLTSNGAIMISDNITLGSGNLTLNGMGGITVTGSRTLSGGAINLTGAITSGSDLTVTATGALTLNSNITARNLTLTAGTGAIMNGDGTRQLNAGTVSLTQASAFDATFAGSSGRFTFASGVDSLVLDAGSAPQTVHDWMVVGGRSLDLTTTGAITIGMDITLGTGNLTLRGTALTSTGTGLRILSGAAVSLSGNATSQGVLRITATSQLTLNSNITTNGAASNLSISGDGISVADGITLTSGNNLTLGGTMTTTAGTGGNGNLTLIAAGTINLNADLTLGTGTATLSAGSATGLAGTSVITANIVNITFGDTSIRVATDVDALDDTGGNTPSITFVNTAGAVVMPTYQFEALGCGTPITEACVIGGTAQLLVEPDLASNISITIETTNVSGSSVRFDGTGTITLTSPLVTIIAETINLEGRNLVIVDAGGGTLALAGNVSGAAAITARNGGGTAFGFINIVGARTIAGDAITLTATLIRTVDRSGSGSGVVITDADHDLTIIATGGLTIATGINTGTGTTLTLIAGPGDITGTGTPMLTADTVSFTQDGTFGDTALFTFAASVGALNLTTDASGLQMVHPWMFAVMDRDLSLTSNGGRLFIGGNINIGAGNLFLSGTSIELSQIVSSIALTGGAVELTGRVDGTVNSNNFTITASGDITLNNNINLGAGDLILDGTSIVLGDGARILNGGAVTLTGAVSATNTPLTITASGDITINDNINLGTGALILTATGANIVDAAGVVPVLTASTVSLTQAGTFAADLFTLAAGVTSLTLNAGSAAQTVHAWIAGGMNRTLSLTTTGAITIGRDIPTGTSNLTLDGGTLVFSGGARILSGADIALTGAATGTDSLTITASGTLTLNSNITLTGSSLTLALSGAGAIGNGGSPTALAASTVSLAQVAEFDGTALFTFTADTLNLTTAAAQTVHGWMTSGNRSLNLTSTGREIATGSINTGTGDLTLSALAIELMGSPSFIGRNVVLDGPVDGRSGGSGSFTVMATGNITINGNVNVGAGTATSITLTADSDGNGTGNILSDVDTGETLTAGTVSLTQAGAFAPDALFTFDPLAVGTLNLTTAAPQTVHAWMVASGRNLSLTSNGGSITVDTAITASRNITLTATTLNINADIGTSSTPITGLLTLDGDTLAFSGARTLSGANISLTGAATNAANLTITTAGTLTIAASIAITGGDLMLTGTSGIVIGTATGAGAFALSGDAITLAGDVTTASNAANSTDLTITAQGTLTVAGIDLSNNDDSAYGDLVLIAGAGTQDADLAFSAGVGTTLNAASVELRQDTDFNATRPATILIEGDDLGDTNPEMITISGNTQVLWAAILVTQGDLTIIDDGNDPDGTADNGIELDTARLSYTGEIMIDAGAMDITFATGLGNITWEASVIEIIAGSIVLVGRNLTIITEGGTLTLNVADITSTGNLVFTGMTINLGRAGFASDLGTTTLTGAAITLTAANGITVGRFTGPGAFRPALAPALVVNALGVLTIAADITSVANITLGSAATDSITITGVRTLSGSVIRFNSDVTANDSAVTANDGLTVNSTAGNLTLNGNIDIGMGALSLTSAAGIRAFGDATRTLTGGDITLTATNGVSAASGVRNLAVTAGGVLTIAANITMRDTLTLRGAGAIGNGGTVRVLTASTVSLRQVDVFATAMPFRFGAVSSLVFMTDAAQAVHTWMIALNSDLTITSAGNVFVRSAIGGGLAGRDLGTGDITLTSGTGFVRIFADILTTGNITLSGTGTTGINFNSGAAAKTLSGAIVMLTGVVVSNRALTITASGTLTLSNNITTTGTNALSLRGGGGITLGSALTTLSGGDIMLRGAATGTADLTITARGILTLNSNITLTGTGNLTLTSGTIQIGRASSDGAGTQRTLSSGANITLTAADGILLGRFNGAGTFFTGGRVANLTVMAQDTLTIAADITVASTATAGGDITLTGSGGGIVIGTAAIGSSTLAWEGSDITLAGAVTTASTAGIDNFTSLTLSAGGNLVVGAIDLGNDAGGSGTDAWGDLRLRADTGTITVTSSSAIIDAGSILFQQDAELFAVTASDEPANLHINGEDVSGTASLRSMVLVLSTDAQASVDWGTVIDADAIDLGTGGALDLEIALNNGVLLSLVSITINAGTGDVTFAGTDDITLAAPEITITAGSINTNNRNLTIITEGGTLTLNSNITLTGTGNLTLTSGTIQIVRGATARTLSSGANITLMAADGILLGRLTGSGFRVNGNAANFTVTAQDTLTIAADITVASTATAGGDITLTGGDIAFGAAARTITGGAITLTGAAMGSANLTITASGILTINNDIDTGAGALTLSGADAIVGGSSTPELTASTVRLTQASVFDATELFTFDAATGSLVLITTDATDATDAVVDQSVHNWMINDGINLTVMSPSRVIVEANIGDGETGRDIGDGSITLTSTGAGIRIAANITTTGAITLDGATGINTSGGTRTLSGEGITLVGRVRSVGAAVIIDANGGILSLNGNVDTRNNATFGDLTLEGATIQIGRAASTLVDTTRILLRGGAITLTSAMGIQIGRFSGSGVFSTNGGVANLTVNAQRVLTIAGNITVASAAASGGDILLTGGSIAFGDAARTITGRVITLTGAATGTADLTITARGTLTINNDIGIGAGALTLSGAGAIVNGGTATLTASTVSLEQDAVFTTTEPFAFGTIDSLALATEAAQVVHNWMIVTDRNLTVESAGTVFVRSAIGSGDRNLGAGDITLESTGGTVRIFVDITTTGAITLIGGTGGINFDSRGAKTLSGGTVTLSGNARSNRDLTLTTTSGALTLNGDINTGTSALSLSGRGGITLGSALTLTGGAITLTGAATGAANLTINASGILTLNDNIGIGAGALTLSGAGVIGNGGTATTLTASTVRLTQVSVFGDPALFTFGGATGSLTLSSTSGNQTVHTWMQTALTGGSLTITTPGNLIVGAAPLNFVGNNITLSGRIVRIGGNITTAGNIILTGTASSAIRFENGAREVRGGNITLNGFAGVLTSTTVGASGGSVTLDATSGILTLNDDIDTGTNNLSLTGGTIQIGRRGADSTDRVIELSGGAITLTSATNGIEIGRFNGRGTFSPNGIVANLTVTASGALTIAGNITAAAASGGGIVLTGGSIAFGAAARTITGGAIALRGAAEGTADLTLTARGTLRVNSSIALTGSTNPALTLMSTAGAVRILADISTTGDMTLSGATGINLNSGRAKTLSGAAITLNGNARSNRAVTITASGILTLNNNITVIGAARTLALSGAGAIVTTGRPRLAASTVRLTQADAFAAGENGIGLFRFRPGSLMLNTDAAQDVHNWMISPGRDVTITSAGQVRVGAAIGADVLGRDLGVRSLTLVSTGADIRIEADITITGNITLSGNTGIDLSGAARTITGRDIMLTGVAMSDANVTITATGALTLNSNIALTGTGSTLALRGAGAIGNGGTAPGELPELTASTVSLRQVDVFGATALFTFGGATGSLELTTTVNQDVHDWMINDGINLTVTSAGTVRVAAAIGPLEGVRNLGNGDLTLESTGGGVRIVADISTGGDLTLNGATGINLRGGVAGARTLAGAAITLNGNTRGNQNLILDASGILGFNGDIIITGTNDLTLMGAMIQIGRRGADSVDRVIELRGGAITLTSAMGIQIGRLNGRGAFLTNGIVANLTVTVSGVLTIAGNITVASTAASGGDIVLTGGSIAFGDAARTITGRAITLSGAATGTADLTLTARGTLTINNDIGIGTNALTLTSGAGAISNGGAVRVLTASTVSLSQEAAFVGARPFNFDFGSTVGSLELTTTVNQDVFNWMIEPDTDLSVTSAGIVRVAAAIGGSGGRNLGNGNLTLTSTGGAVRILANISTGGNLTLSGVGTAGINFSGGVRILNGAIVTLTGAARSNRDLTITATGVLTINNNINIGTRALSLTGTSLTFGSSVDLTAGDHIFDPTRTCDGSTPNPTCTDTTP